MSEFKSVDGKIVELVEQEVVDDQIEANLQEELDEAQNELNTQAAYLADAEQKYLAAEDAAESASKTMDQTKLLKDAAEAKLSKSVSRRDSWAEAVRVRQEQLESKTSDDDDSDATEGTETGTEAVPIPVTIAEG